MDKVKIGHSYYSWNLEEYKGSKFYSLKQVQMPYKEGSKAKVKVISVSPVNLAEFRSFLLGIVKEV